MAGFDIKIDTRNWKLVLEGQGFKGDECLKTADELEKALGIKAKSQKLKPEFVRRVNTQKVGAK